MRTNKVEVGKEEASLVHLQLQTTLGNWIQSQKMQVLLVNTPQKKDGMIKLWIVQEEICKKKLNKRFHLLNRH